MSDAHTVLISDLIAAAQESRTIAMRCYEDGGSEDDTPIEGYVEFQASVAIAALIARVAELEAALRLVAEHSSIMARLEPDAHDAIVAAVPTANGGTAA